MTPGHPACASSALPNVCFYWNNNHHNNNRWGPAMPALLAGMMPWACQLRVALPGYQFDCREPGSAMKSWDRWDGKEAGERAGSQKASVTRADCTDSSLQNFAGLAFFWWKIVAYVCWGAVPLWAKSTVPARLDLSPRCAPWSRAAGPGQVASMGQHRGVWHGLLSKGHPAPRPRECAPGN